MRTETKRIYEEGDTVFAIIWDKAAFLPQTCSTCEGLKMIVANGKPKECPTCRGRGETLEHSYHFIATVKEAKIKCVRSFDDGYVSYSLEGNVSVVEELMFPTREEADAHVAKIMHDWFLRKTP
jgi:hypothetical protein